MEGRKRKRRFDFFVPLMAIIIGYFAFVLVSQQVHLGQLAENQAAAEARLSAAQEENEALKQEKVARQCEGKQIVKVIYVKNKLVNLIIR